MNISSAIFEAYLKCPTKCYLRIQGESGTGSDYTEWLRNQNESYRNDAIRRLQAGMGQQECVARPPVTENLKLAKWQIAVELVVQAQNVESIIDAVERIPSEKSEKAAQFIPNRYIFRNKLTKDDKLLLAFDAFVLSEQLGRKVELGKIIHGDDHVTLKVKTASMSNRVGKMIEKIVAVLSTDKPPDLVLNRHCGECEFQARCRQKAIEKDDLSLLSGMSEKERKKLNGKGIFTVTQFSYTFRPRKRPKKTWCKRKCEHSLRALALRNQTIYIAKRPTMSSSPCQLYVDVEGIPDRDFYYLIGLTICREEGTSFRQFWASESMEEGAMWASFLKLISELHDFTLFHYGSYETMFFKDMKKRYGGDPQIIERLTARSVNILSMIYGNIYFPTYSNNLKSVAAYLGFKWSGNEPTGIESIVWRCEWEEKRQDELKNRLFIYNHEDCMAAKLVRETLGGLQKGPSEDGNLNTRPAADVGEIKLDYAVHRFGRNEFVLPEFERINRCAYFDYQRAKVYLRTSPTVRRSLVGERRKKACREHMRRLKVNTEVQCDQPYRCPACGRGHPKKHMAFSRVVYDLKLLSAGVKRWMVRYKSAYYRCFSCGAIFVPESFKSLLPYNSQKYGRTLIGYAVYQNIALGQSNENLAEQFREIFGYHFHRAGIKYFKARAAAYYESTYLQLREGLRKGRLIHVDETQVVTRSGVAYVWVFADMQRVFYVYSDTREGTILHETLEGFEGVLVSDFYAVYDSVKCAQQKCHIHLIRDMNDDLFRNPFDEELKELAREYTMLFSPIIETIDRYGLAAYHLWKHRDRVDKFLGRILSREYVSDNAKNYQRRFRKCGGVLFTFLQHDGVPWNNNNAEHVIKRIAKTRNRMKGLTTSRGIREYLILLSICETLTLSNVAPLKFFVSGCRDIDAYLAKKQPCGPAMEDSLSPADSNRHDA